MFSTFVGINRWKPLRQLLKGPLQRLKMRGARLLFIIFLTTLFLAVFSRFFFVGGF